MTNINSLSMEHDGIRASMRSLVDMVNQQFEIAHQSMTNALSAEQLKFLEEKGFNIEQNWLSLENAVKNHYVKEKEFLRTLLGTLLKKAIAKETTAVLLSFERMTPAITTINFEESNREQALGEIALVKQQIDALSELVEAHAVRMNNILKLIEGYLETEKHPG
jgi:hypothetical protein